MTKDLKPDKLSNITKLTQGVKASDCGVSSKDLTELLDDYPWLDGAAGLRGTLIKIVLKLVKDVAALKAAKK
jgi:hypothetical protein